MNELEIKQHLLAKGLKVADIADKMHEDFPDVKRSALQVMVHQLIAGQRWYPKYAKWLKRKYGIAVQAPAPYQGVRERLRRAA